MSITFTAGLEPTFPDGSFDSELEHIKLFYTQVAAGTGYVNVLKVPVETLVAKIDTRITELTTAKTGITADIATLQGYIVNPPNNLPQSWVNAGYGASDITSIITALQGVLSNLNTAIDTTLAELKAELNTPDIDNFKLHMDLLSGIREVPPQDIPKPNNPSLMGLVRAVTDIEHRFGITFTNYLVLVFETLFLGDLTVANAQTDLDADPLVGTYASLNVVGRVNASPPENNAPTAIIASINTFSAPLSAWNTAVAENKPIFEQHIADDKAEYESLTNKMDRYMQAYQIAGYIQDPYYAFMYTDVFGSSTVVNIIQQYQNGDIT